MDLAILGEQLLARKKELQAQAKAAWGDGMAVKRKR
jgi:hypothetical protein